MNNEQNSLIQLIRSIPTNSEVQKAFVKRVRESALTRDENPLSHFCVYFAGYDPYNSQVFIGHHKKADLWLFNGGHIDKGELPFETLKREAKEEWGDDVKINQSSDPSFLTITKIDNLPVQKCRSHYDIWYFIPLNKKTFNPDPELLAREFHECGWKTIGIAKELITQPQTLVALAEIEKLFK
jgi:8-oxo-dGTP pyrophosphatase MutT (NUDIX family)